MLIAVAYVCLALILGSDTFCTFKLIYGIPCPGCGFTRSLFYLLKLDFKNAFYYYPLFLLVLFSGFVFLFQKNKIISKLYYHQTFWIVLLIIFIMVWIVRMYLFFPHTPPMDYNYSSIFYKVYHFVRLQFFH